MAVCDRLEASLATGEAGHRLEVGQLIDRFHRSGAFRLWCHAEPHAPTARARRSHVESRGLPSSEKDWYKDLPS